MLYANDEIFNVGYNGETNRLKVKKERWTSKVNKILKKNKFITTVIVMFIACSLMNFALIYSFMEILKNI